jgi:hypothetical protein
MSKQFEELSDTITDTMENLEHISVFSRSGNTVENIMVYKTRIQLELSHLQGSELDIMAYCNEEWKYFTKTYPNVSEEILPSIKALLRYDECMTFFSKENVEKRKKEEELAELRKECSLDYANKGKEGWLDGFSGFLFLSYIGFALFLLFTKWTFVFVYHLPIWIVLGSLAHILVKRDEERTNKLFEQRKKERGL